jgi:CheY-like chemotaxis protein
MSDRAVRVLVAESGSVNQTFTRSLVEKRGHGVVVVGHATQALDAARDGGFDVILIDVALPGGGIDAIESILELPGAGDVPVIALLSDLEHDERRRCVGAGVEYIIERPLQPDELFEVLDGLTAGDSPSGRSGGAPVRLDLFTDFMREAGVEELVDETLTSFRDELRGREERIVDAIRRSDAKGIEAEAHALRSASLSIWAVGLAEHLDQVEQAGRSGDVDSARSFVEPLSEEVERVLGYLDTLLHRAG